MNKLEAKNLICKTFENPFNEAQFTYFIKNLLNNVDESKKEIYRGNLIPDSYEDAVSSYKRIGQYKDVKNNVIDLLIVKLKKETSLERARSMQRNFIARYLKKKTHDAALVAYYTDGNNDWRFSFVKMDISLKDKKIETDFTPARRYSFLVGTNEGSHTAQNQFVKLLSEKEDNPTLDNIENAFNIETVSKEFFLKYRDLFIRFKQELDIVVKNDSIIKTDFETKEINSVSFAKKLLGQIVFLYFLQKKGWFGVDKNSAWGSGSKKFLRELFEKKHCTYKNFFNDILEPLFYEALSDDRSSKDHYYSRFDCKIPFLNGGLFDPIGNYDWVKTDIVLPNELFSNSNTTKEGDIGDGILDVFDRYNFTVIEDEPLEKEVAIDPELLGKTYEKFNAIRPDNFDEYLKALKSGNKGEESKFNKQYGVYYTPREIVHYMCRESLINYLATEFDPQTDSFEKLTDPQLDLVGNAFRNGQLPLEIENKSNPFIAKKDIETLINYGELFEENEAAVEAKGKETNTYYYKLHESIRVNAELIDAKLAAILICDPAVGSGAFPVGMMHEIVSTRNILSIFIKDTNRNKYKYKRKCIEKSLYGVDIDPGAVEIAKLRLWLSLVVDEDDIANIKPLPNLDYKIVCGDSLLGFPENWQSSISDQIDSLKTKFFTETHPLHKRELMEEIDKQIKSRLVNSEKNFGYAINFDFNTFFSEVYHLKGGFDITISNPPYITYKGKQKVSVSANYVKSLIQLYSNSAEYKINSYALFIERSMRLLNVNGILSFIIPSTILQNEYLKKVRKLLLNKYQLSCIVSFSNKIFEAITDSIVLFSIKTPINGKMSYLRKSNLDFSLFDDIKIYNQSEWAIPPDFVINLKLEGEENGIISKIEVTSQILDNYLEVYVGIVANGIKKFLSNKILGPTYKKYLQGRHINNYCVIPVELYINFDVNKLHSNTDEKVYQKNEKLLVRKTGNKLIAAYDSEKYYTDQSLYNLYSKPKNSLSLKYILALLNSRLMNFYFNKKMITNPDVFPYIKGIHLKQLPIQEVNTAIQSMYVTIVDKLLTAKKINPQANTKELEDQIDIMVYKLYNLTYEEVKIIDPEIEKLISKEEYEKFVK